MLVLADSVCDSTRQTAGVFLGARIDQMSRSTRVSQGIDALRDKFLLVELTGDQVNVRPTRTNTSAFAAAA